MKKLNLNHFVKVKFTDHGKDIYYHQYDELNAFMKSRGIAPLVPTYPKVDENGYSSMQLWHFIQLYGPHIGVALPNVIEDMDIYIDERDLAEVDAPLEAVIPLREKERRIQVIRSICGSYYKGACDGKCTECLDRFLAEKEGDK